MKLPAGGGCSFSLQRRLNSAEKIPSIQAADLARKTPVCRHPGKLKFPPRGAGPGVSAQFQGNESFSEAKFTDRPTVWEERERKGGKALGEFGERGPLLAYLPDLVMTISVPRLWN